MAHPLGRPRLALFALAVVLALVPTAARADSADELTCGQEPGNRFFWIERAFCDLSPNGPERANGIVIWNHGIHTTLESWRAPAPPAFRLLQARGWDVVMLKRHNLAETSNVLYRTVRRTLDEVAAARKQGYRKVVLAGQSFGGYVALEAIDTTADIDAAVAFAPGSRAYGATGRLDPAITDRILQRAKVGRLALVFPKDDDVFNHIVRGESAQAILTRRTLPYLLLDETSGLSGHGGGVTGRFALRYGLCLAEFLAAPSPPARRFTCPPIADDWPVVRELLLPAPEQRPVFARVDAALAPPLASLVGLRWALLGDSVVLVAPVEERPGQLRLMYRSTGLVGGVFDATVVDGVIRAVLSNKSTVTLKPDGDGTITWTAADGSRSFDARLLRGREGP